MRRSALIFTALFLSTLLAASPQANAAETLVSGAVSGTYPAGTTFNAIPIQGLDASFGLEFSDIGDKVGHFTAILLGVSALGLERTITIEGDVTAGSRTADNVAVISGTCSVDMGDGTPPLLNVPFTVTIATDANDQGTVGLVIGTTTLPDGIVNDGSMTVE